jgi:hypothetical protein
MVMARSSEAVRYDPSLIRTLPICQSAKRSYVTCDLFGIAEIAISQAICKAMLVVVFAAAWIAVGDGSQALHWAKALIYCSNQEEDS